MKPTVLLTALLSGLVLFGTACEINVGVDFMDLRETPASSAVVEGTGLEAVMHLGWYDAPFAHLNVIDALLAPPENPDEQLRLKRWHFFSFASERYMIGLAAVDANFIANGFGYIYDVDTDTLKEFSNVGQPTVVSISENSFSGESLYDVEGFRIHVVNDGARHTVDFAFDDGTDTLRGTLESTEIGEPFVQAKEVAWHHVVYTHQNSMGAASGTATWNGEPITFDPATDFSGMDYTAGIQNYETFWNWASGTGYATDGTPLAVNLGGEAIFWVGSAIQRNEGVTFTYSDLLSDWTIRSADGLLDLTFHPVGMREGIINVLNVIVSEFYQPFGYFSGTITGDDGTVYTVDTMLGVTEEHFARW